MDLHEFILWPKYLNDSKSLKKCRAAVARAEVSNDILRRTKCTLMAPNCLVGFNPSITKYCPGCQLSRDRGKHIKTSTNKQTKFK